MTPKLTQMRRLLFILQCKEKFRELSEGELRAVQEALAMEQEQIEWEWTHPLPLSRLQYRRLRKVRKRRLSAERLAPRPYLSGPLYEYCVALAESPFGIYLKRHHVLLGYRPERLESFLREHNKSREKIDYRLYCRKIIEGVILDPKFKAHAEWVNQL